MPLICLGSYEVGATDAGAAIYLYDWFLTFPYEVRNV